MRVFGIKRIICDECGEKNPKRLIHADGTKGYNLCCGWGKPFKQYLHIRWPFKWE